MAKAKKGTFQKKKNQKTTPRMTKNKLIKVISEEPLAPQSWHHNFNKEGKRVNNRSIECVGCAVGAVISQAKKDGTLKKFSFDDFRTSSGSRGPDYYKALAKGGCYLTALSDMFESECKQYEINEYTLRTPLTFFADKAILERKLKSKKKAAEVNEYDKERLTNPENVKRYEKELKDYNSKIAKVKRKLIAFVKKNFPDRVPLRPENEEMKYKALEDTDYSV